MGLRHLALYLFMLAILFGVVGYAYLAQQRGRHRGGRHHHRRRRHHGPEQIDLFGKPDAPRADAPGTSEQSEDQEGAASGPQPPPSAL